MDLARDFAPGAALTYFVALGFEGKADPAAGHATGKFMHVCFVERTRVL